MKFVRKDLLDVLSSLRPAIAEQGLIPELSYIWFTGKSVRAFNGGLGIRRLLKTDFACGLPGKVLLDLLATSSQEFVSLDEADNDVALQLGGKGKVIRLGRMPVDAAVWPFPPQFPKDRNDAYVLTEAFIDALGTLKFVKTAKPMLVVHNGVLVVPEGEGKTEGIALYSTDSNTIARIRVSKMTVKEPFLIDWKLADQIAKNFGVGAKLLVERDRLVVGGSGGILIGSNRLELPDTPDVPAFFRKAYVKDQIELPKGFATALQRASIVAGTEDPIVVLDVADKVLTVKASYSLGLFDDKIMLPTAQPTMKRVFTAPMITRALDLSTKFVVGPQALSLSGARFGYVVATRDQGAEKKARKTKKRKTTDG